MRDPMQVTNEQKFLETGILKLPKTKIAYIGMNYSANNGRIKQGNLNCTVDSTGYVCAVLRGTEELDTRLRNPDSEQTSVS
jgi:hypothetical protein